VRTRIGDDQVVELAERTPPLDYAERERAHLLTQERAARASAEAALKQLQAVQKVSDAALMAHADVNFHPLVNTATTTVARDDLVRFLTETNHPPRILALPKPDGTGVSGDGAPS